MLRIHFLPPSALALVGFLLFATAAPLILGQDPARPIRRIDVSWSVEQAMLQSKVALRYPEEAKSKHITGVVKLDVLIAPDGSVVSAKPVSGPEELRQASIDCVTQWKFKPFLINGEAVHVRTEIPTSFFITK